MVIRFLQVCIMAAWAAFFLWLYAFDQPALARLLHPRLWWLVLGGAIVLVLFSGVALDRLNSPKPTGTLRWAWPSYLVLLVPLIYFWPMQSARFDSRTFLNRSTQISTLAPVQNENAAQDLIEPTDELALLETLSSQIVPDSQLQDNTATQAPLEPTKESASAEASFSQIILNPQQYAGHKIEVLCQTLSDQRLPNDQFICYRFRITCCAADALPLFVFAEKHGLQIPANDSWVRVQGVLSTHMVDGIPFPLIHTKGIHAEKEPSFPFVF